MVTKIKLLDVYCENNLIMIEETRPHKDSFSRQQTFVKGYIGIGEFKRRLDDILVEDSEVNFLERKKEFFSCHDEDRYNRVYDELLDYINSKKQRRTKTLPTE